MQESSPSPILTVSELTSLIKTSLERQFPFVQLQGEISNLKIQSSGHIYFSLKDEEAAIQAVIFRSSASSLSRPLKDGDKVIVEGKLALYAPQGRYQIIIQKCRFAGMGELLLKLEELKKKLAALGWFDKDKKKALPFLPKTIGVVTSPTGAVIRDILHVLKRRFSGFHLILNPVKVQGEGAKEEIAKAIADFNRYQLADVLIIGRGGGSIEDLWAFNEEIVIRAIHESKIPVISAVGHETDVTLADFAADVRAPTPSAAAEIAIAHKAELVKRISAARQSIGHIWKQRISRNRDRLRGILRHPVFQTSNYLFSYWNQKLDNLKEDIERSQKSYIEKTLQRLQLLSTEIRAKNPLIQLKTIRSHFIRLQHTLDFKMSALLEGRKRALSTGKRREICDMWISHQIQKTRRRLGSLCDTLSAISPKQLLNKGYAIVFSEKNNSAITSVLSLEIGQSLRIQLHDGSALSTVRAIETKESFSQLQTLGSHDKSKD